MDDAWEIMKRNSFDVRASSETEAAEKALKGLVKEHEIQEGLSVVLHYN